MAKTTKKAENPMETRKKFYLSHKNSPELFRLFPLPKIPKEFSGTYFSSTTVTPASPSP